MGCKCATAKQNKSRIVRDWLAQKKKCKPAPINKCAPAPINKCEPAPINKCESAPINKCEPAPINKCESTPINKCESTPINKCEPAPINKCEPAPINKCESAPINKCESTPINKCESIPINKCESTPINKCESAPINKCEPAPINKCESTPINKCESTPINKCESAPMPAKIPTSIQELKKKIYQNEIKFSLSKNFTLTFDAQLRFLIYRKLIKFIYVLSDKRLIIYTEDHSLTVVSFNIGKKEWIIDFKMTDSKIYYTFACCEINDNQLLTLETKAIKIWKISQNNLQFIRELTSTFCEVSSLIYLGKESLIASASKEKREIKIWQCEHPFTVKKTIEPEEFIHILHKVKSYDKLIGAGKVSIYIWSTKTYKYIGKIKSIYLKMSNYIELPNGYLAVSQESKIKIVDLNTADEYGENSRYEYRMDDNFRVHKYHRSKKKYIVQVIEDDEYITGDKYLDQDGSLFLLDTKSFIYSRRGVLIKFLIKENQYCKMVDRGKDNLLELVMFVNYDNQYIIFENTMVAFYGLQKAKVCEVCNNEDLEKSEQEQNHYPTINENLFQYIY